MVDIGAAHVEVILEAAGASFDFYFLLSEDFVGSREVFAPFRERVITQEPAGLISAATAIRAKLIYEINRGLSYEFRRVPKRAS